MSCATVSHDHAVNILQMLFPETNWDLFLAKNRHGLTDGYPVIPYDHNCEIICYELEKLHQFAYRFGAGRYSEERIQEISKKYLDDLDCTFELKSLLNDLETQLAADEGGDELGVRHEGDSDALILSSNEYANLCMKLSAIMEEQDRSRDALTTLAFSFRALAALNGNVRDDDVEAIANVALDHAARVVANSNELLALVGALDRRVNAA